MCFGLFCECHPQNNRMLEERGLAADVGNCAKNRFSRYVSGVAKALSALAGSAYIFSLSFSDSGAAWAALGSRP